MSMIVRSGQNNKPTWHHACRVAVIACCWALAPSALAQSCPSTLNMYHPLDELAAGTYVDEVSTNDGTCVDCPVPATGILNGAQDFERANSDRIDVPSDAAFDFAGNDSFSIEYWLNKSSACTGSGVSTVNQVAVARADGSLQWWSGVFCRNVGDQGKIRVILQDTNSVNGGLLGTTDVIDGMWHQVVLVRDGVAGVSRLYVDGVEEDSDSTVYTGSFAGTTEFTIGYQDFGQSNTDFFFDGLIDEVVVHNVSLTATEVNDRRTAVLAGLGACECTADGDCDDGVACTTDSCDLGTGVCSNAPDDALCDDAMFCNGMEMCDSVAGCLAGGDPCDDGVTCTDDTCDEGLDACSNTANDANCGNGLFCDGAESCDALAGCQAGTDPCPGQLCNDTTDACVDCLVDGDCTRRGTICDIGTGTCVECVGAGDCDDGVSCTVDVCNAGMCQNTATDALCDDGLFCTGIETCDALMDCQAGTYPCRGQLCDDAGDVCFDCTLDGECDDGVFCNGSEACVGGMCVAGGDPCNDGVTCTDDGCDEATDSCSNLPNNVSCDDSLFCNGPETCDALLGCVAGGDPCDDGVTCTDDGCDEAADSCSSVPNDTTCDDSLFCNGAETCDVVLGCVVGGDPCDDGVTCTDDGCDEAADSCSSVANDTTCDDSLFCNGAETCDVVLGCVAGGSPCEDGVTCTSDGCDEVADACVFLPEDSVCANGLFCDGLETCDPVAGCQAGTPVDCSDGVACTADGCDEDRDACDHIAVDLLCDDGIFCNGVETCHITLDCQFPGDSCPGQLCVEVQAMCCMDSDDDGVCDADDACPGFNDTLDADADLVPDDCDNCVDDPNPGQADCDDNDQGDVCAISSGGSADCNSDGIPDECQAIAMWVGVDGAAFGDAANWTPSGVPTGQAVMTNLGPGDNRSVASQAATLCGLSIDALALGTQQTLEISSTGSIHTSAAWNIGDGAQLSMRGGLAAGPIDIGGIGVEGYGTVSGALTNQSVVRGSPIASLTLTGSMFNNAAGATLIAPFGSVVIVASDSILQEGTFEVEPIAAMLLSTAVSNVGTINLVGGAIGVPQLVNELGGQITGFGVLDTDLSNNGQVLIVADTEMTGDLVNDGSVVVQNGLLTVLGALSGTGTLIGDFGPGPDDGRGVVIHGGLHLPQDGRLHVAHGELVVGGDIDVAVTEPADFNLVDARLRMSGLSSEPQHFEVAADDAGRTVALPDVQRFSINELHIEGSVQLVDQHGNSSGEAPEVVYFETLVLEPGSHLDLNGLVAYYGQVVPADPFAPDSGVTVVDTMGGGELLGLCAPSLFGDVNQDGLRDLADIVCSLDGFAEEFSVCTLPAVDLAPCSGDGAVTLDDILFVLDAFSGTAACPDFCP
jgi:hypothetical protein